MEQEAKVNWTWAELGKCESKGGWWRLQEIENREQQEGNRIARGQRGKPWCYIENQWYGEEATWGGKKAQDAGVTAVKCLTGTYESGLKDLEASMDADMQPQEHVSEAMCPFCQGEGK